MKKMNEKITIPLSKSKITLLTIGSLAFVIAGYYMYFKTSSFIGIISIIFFGITGIFGLFKLFGNSKGIEIDEYGISDHSNASSIGLIEWEDITDISEMEVSSQNFIMIYINNPEKYIEKSKNAIQKRFLRMNLKLYGTPFFITPTSLKFDFKETQRIIQTEFEKHKLKK